jgi:hypothetical protein
MNIIKTKQIKKKILHYPTLKTVLSVEKVLKEAALPINKEEIKRRLNTKIHHLTLNLILAYLEDSGKIFIGKKGVEWTFNENTKFKVLCDRSYQIK